MFGIQVLGIQMVTVPNIWNLKHPITRLSLVWHSNGPTIQLDCLFFDVFDLLFRCHSNTKPKTSLKCLDTGSSDNWAHVHHCSSTSTVFAIFKI